MAFNYLSDKKSKWTDEKTRKLMDLAGTMTIEDLAKKLDMSIKAVKAKCFRQGVKYGFHKNHND